jgi:Anti-sigma-K factor rskA
MSGPNFDDLVGSELASSERERLQRAHQALVASGPPPELPPALRYAPGTEEFKAEVRTLPRGYPPRRLAAAVVLAAAIAIAAFVGGYGIRGGDDGAQTAPEFVRQVELRGGAAPDALAVVQIAAEDSVGNREMVVTVEGLPHLHGEDYYTLFMTRAGQTVVPCGTFNVRGGVRRTTVRLLVGYGLEDFDGLALSKYSKATHKDTIVLSGKLA